MKLGCVTLNSPDAEEHADFYQRMLGWSIRFSNEDGGTKFVGLVNENGMCLLFQEIDDFVRPVYPNKPGEPQSTAHIDFHTDDIEKDVSTAIAYGAELSEVQYSDKWKVMIDPMGHPFCIELIA